MPAAVSDDTTVNSTIQIDLPAQTRFLNVMAAVIEGVLLRAENVPPDEEVTRQVVLAVHEACTNIVLHAYEGIHNGRIRARITLHPDRITVVLRDTGAPFNPDRHPDPVPGVAQVHGYGLYLMHNLVDEVHYHAQPTGNTWTMTKLLTL